LRNQLHQLNQHLGQIASRSLRKVTTFHRQNKENRAYVENLLQTNPHPLFITDKTGRLVRCNMAFIRLLGWDENYLAGKKLKTFLTDPADWALVSQVLAQSQSLVERQVRLTVHCGIRIKARLYLIPLFAGKRITGALGRLEEAAEQQPESNAPLSLEEAISLAHLSGEAVDYMNNLLTAFRCNLQLLLLQDVLPPVRKRLEVLESLTQDQGGVIHQVQLCVEAIAQKCRSAEARRELWQDSPPAPDRTALGDCA
jgi:PAS domain S-box-containing protein